MRYAHALGRRRVPARDTEMGSWVTWYLTIAIAITLWGSVGGLALVHRPDELVGPFRRVGLLVRVAVFDLLVIPPAAWLVTELLGVPDPFAIGIILVGATSAGPLSVVAVQLARGDTILALATVTWLEIANALAVPAWAAILLPRSTTVPMGPVVVVLIAGVLLPVVVGTLMRMRAPALADRLVPIARVVSIVGLVAVMVHRRRRERRGRGGGRGGRGAARDGPADGLRARRRAGWSGARIPATPVRHRARERPARVERRPRDRRHGVRRRARGGRRRRRVRDDLAWSWSR